MRRLPFLVVSLASLAVGLLMIFSSISWGTAAANAYLLSHGGGMDSTQFAIILQESISMYKWIGAVLAVFGGTALVKVVEIR